MTHLHPAKLRDRFLSAALGLGLSALAAAPLQAATPDTARPALPAGPAATSGNAGTGVDLSQYWPAILRLSFTQGSNAADPARPAGKDSFLDLILIPPEGEPIGRRTTVSTAEFAELLRLLYGQLSRQESLDVDNPSSPSRLIYRILFEPIAADLQRLGITTLLISADQGLQAVPFGALHDGQRFLGEQLAFSLTPSVGLTPLTVPSRRPRRLVALGASRFDELSALPLVPQEVNSIEGESRDVYLNQDFTPNQLLETAADPTVDRMHVATHAEFQPGGPNTAVLFTGAGPFPLTRFASLRQRRSGALLDLIGLSACRTALGDKNSELGFAGLALQAGSRSAIGTLWYVDDVATSAFFIQFYRYLESGYPKAEALRATRRAMALGQIRLQGGALVGPDGLTLLEGLTPSQQARVRNGLDHPFFWAGISLLGTPW